MFNLGGITEVDAVGEANIIGTGRVEAVIHPVGAKVTFLSRSFSPVEGDGSVRAYLEARLTARATFPVEDDDPVLPLGDGLLGTGVHTRGSVTVFTDIYAVNEIELPIDPFGPIFSDIDIIDPLRLLMLLLAGDFAGLTSPAGILVDTERNLTHRQLSFLLMDPYPSSL